MNERLRAAILQAGLTPGVLAAKVDVDLKTVQRWIVGRTPYRRHRYAVSTVLGVDETYLWPDALPREQVAVASESELIAVYPHRLEVPREVWEQLFESARTEIGVLVYAGLFLSEDAGLQRSLIRRAASGVRVRVLIGDPDSPHVDQRSVDEGSEGAVAVKIRNALNGYRELRQAEGVKFRLHRTVLYNSIYRSDDQVLVNTHIYGLPAAQAPVWHLRHVAGGELATTFFESFERVWKDATPMGD